jgi:hypothetical protein
MAHGESYEEFVEKFKPKKTTDDCYTPPAIYEAVKDWAVKEYGIDPAKIVRPFYPGGDYERFEYPEGCIALDNPPFSILSKILRFYDERGIAYFLFAPTLTMFSSMKFSLGGGIVTDIAVEYENGAKVNTSFVTSLGDARVRSAPELYARLMDVNAEGTKQKRSDSRRRSIEYPGELLRSTEVGRMSRAGVDFSVPMGQALVVGKLDAQRKTGDAIFGSGMLLSHRAAEEKARAVREADAYIASRVDAVRWELSERERQIVAELSKGE